MTNFSRVQRHIDAGDDIYYDKNRMINIRNLNEETVLSTGIAAH